MVVTVGGTSYHMDNGLKSKWDALKGGKLSKYDEDRVYITDGTEGAGKSLFTIQQGAYIDPTILDDVGDEVMPRICFSAKEFLHAIRNNQSTDTHTKVVIFDEAFRGLSSKSALSSNNKMIVEALMEARQNNLILFIVSPSFYLIEFYAAVLRSQALFHVMKEKKTRKRYVRVFGKQDKNKLYQIGVRKGWGYPVKTRIRVRFYNKYPGGDDFEAKYRKKKRDSFRDNSSDKKPEHKWNKQRREAFKIIHSMGKTYQEMEDMFRKVGIPMTYSQISKICRVEDGQMQG